MMNIFNVLDDYIQSSTADASHQLSMALDSIIKKTLQDSNYRIGMGRSAEFWNKMRICLDKSSQDTECLIHVLKLGRNVVAGEMNNQLLAFESGILDDIEHIVSAEVYGKENQNMTVIQVGTQAICNMITNNCRLIEPIWALWMTNDRGLVWSDILSKNNNTAIMCVFILVINCIRGNKNTSDQLVRSRVGNTLILAILADLERLHEDEKNQNFELGYTIFSELIHQGYLRELFDLAKDARKEYTLSSHQIILLKILDSKIHAYKESFPSFMGPKELEAVIQLFTVVAKETIQVIIAVKESKSDTRSELEVEQVSNIYTGMVLLLQILNDLAVTDHERQSVKALLVGVDTVSLVTDILGHLESFKLPQSQNENPELGFNYMKRECIRMIGTLCYKDQMIQDEVRNKGAIPLILCQFKIDDSNPYIREYATLALRNVMENNRENQELIAELQPQEVIQSEELTRMGLTPEIMKDGKIRINRTEL